MQILQTCLDDIFPELEGVHKGSNVLSVCLSVCVCVPRMCLPGRKLHTPVPVPVPVPDQRHVMYPRVTSKTGSKEHSLCLCNTAHPTHTYVHIFAIYLYIFVYVANGQLHKMFLPQIAKWPRATSHACESCSPAACPAIWLILDETNPNFAILYACYFCVCAAHKNFWPIFLRLHLPGREWRTWRRERSGSGSRSSTKSNKSPSHDNGI